MFSCTTADYSLGAGDYLQLSHYLEGQDLQHLKKGTSDAEKVTLSFYVRSNKTGTYIVEFYDADNARSISKSYTIISANTFQRKTITIDGYTTGAFVNNNCGSLGLFFYLGAGSTFTSGTLNPSLVSRTLANISVGQVNLADSTDNEWYITGVQLEVGEQATPFEHRSFGEELALCQRYFEKIEIGSGGGYASGAVNITNQARVLLPFSTTKRAVPTASATSASTFSVQVNGGGSTPTSISFAGTTSLVSSYVFAIGSFTLNHPVVLVDSDSSNSHFEFDSEL